MPVPGLDNRLKQHGRRAGIMVGLTMAATIAVCIGLFTFLYVQIDPLTRDFVNAATAAPTKKAATKRTPTATSVGGASANEVTAGEVAETQPTNTPPPEPTPTPTPQGFNATHRVSSSIEGAVNLRPGPGVNSGDPVANIESGTELQYLGETQNSQDPDADPGVRWMRVRMQDGIEGWIRQDFVDQINAGQ